MGLGAILAGGAMAGGILGNLSNRDNSNKYLEAALAEIRGINVPDPEKMKITLQKLVEAGQLTPEQARSIFQDPTEFAKIQESPIYKNAQLAALDQLQQIANEGGLTATDRSKIANINDSVNQASRGRRGAIMQNAQERGISGSGLEMAQLFGQDQSAASDASRQATDVAALAEQRALEAMLASGNMARGLSNDDYNRQSDKARAQDIINQFNTRNRQDVMNQNVDRRNDAQQFNLANRQDISNQNVAMENRNRERNSDLIQSQFENRMNRGRALAGINQTQAEAERDRADRRAAFYNSLIAFGGNMAAGTARGGGGGGRGSSSTPGSSGSGWGG